MKLRLGIMGFILLLLSAVNLFAYEDLGTLEQAKKMYPAIFILGEVTQIKIDKDEYYVFCGQSEKLLDSESDSELWEEATISAKTSFLKWINKHTQIREFTISKCITLYQYKSSTTYTVVLAVPVT